MADDPPRLTKSLRLFNDVFQSDIDEEALLAHKKRTLPQDKKTWSNISDGILKQCKPGDITKLQSVLKEFVQTAKDLIGDEDKAAVDSATVFLYNLFINSPDWCKSHGETIRKTFGPYPASVAMKACDLVKRITSILPETSQEIAENNSVAEIVEFGSKIFFKYNSNFLEKTDAFTSARDSLSSDEEEVKSKHDIISKTLLTGLTESHDRQMTSHVAKPKKSHDSNKYSYKWLETQCKKCMSELPWEQLYHQLFDLLVSDIEGAAIESSIAELLGFSNLDFVQELITNKATIVDTILSDPPTHVSSHVTKTKSHVTTGTSKLPHQHPVVGSQVTIMSEDEKDLLKKLKREEKKEKKLKIKLEKEQDTDHITHLKSQGYDPSILRIAREIELEEAARRPVLTSNVRSSSDSTQQYPNVYDSLAKAQLSSAFISGKQVGLPENATRKNTDYFEEICVPHSSTAPPNVADKVLVKELDEIVKMAFQGIKSLNTIQSAVFDTAFYTNENLLISAPTGAGKTNIALLTILREISNNIEAGVIKKSEFKVIYVAPMKALAAEMVRNFSYRLAPLGITVRELTGDIQLTKQEIHTSQMIVTTPEKWDVVTRKATGDVALSQLVRLLIIDEVHLLHEDRGAVIECLVARTLRQVESSQKLIRIVGLSATLPNYVDVARFLRVNPYKGLFYFDGRFRPVPLSQTFIGVKTPNILHQLRDMDRICYNKVLNNIRNGYQVMVFVHARNATVRTAIALKEMAASKGEGDLIAPEQSPALGQAEKQVRMSGYKPLRDLFPHGFGVHHAGMLRKDRNLVEKLFSDGLIKVLVCTATLAWGVNLPAHAVIIKGTQIYDAKKGSFVDLGILDVLQIFGRAGRPQFDTFGEGTIITTHDKLSHYISLLTRQQPIESQLLGSLADCLNAEISLGTVSNIEEATQWLTYTYLHIRIHRNSLAYGINYHDKELDPTLENYQRGIIVNAAKSLDKARMIRYVERTGSLSSTDVGRIASNFYIKHATIETFNGLFKSQMTEGDIVAMVAQSHEFEQIKVRDDELSELDSHLKGDCYLPVKGGVENTHGKVNILLQTYISRGNVESFSLVSDLAYTSQNSSRIMRGLFEIALKKGWPAISYKLLTFSKSIDLQQWSFEHPLKQFKHLSFEILEKLEMRKITLQSMKDMEADDIGHMIHHVRMGREVKRLVEAFPALSLDATIQPITRTVLRVRLTVTPDFEWDTRIHGNSCEPWWVWVEDAENEHIYHSEYFLLQQKQVLKKESQDLIFTIPIFEPLPPQYLIRMISDRWLEAEAVIAISFKHLILPELHPPHTKLLDLHPLPISALKGPQYEVLYKFPYFNPIQTQLFHTLYHTDTNVLLGAPTGSGKTVAAELAMFRVFEHYPRGKCIYIAPLKALVRERIDDWTVRFERKLGRRVIELTGDTAPDIRSIEKADVIVTTPEKWDGISRSWQNRAYVQAMRLLVIDEIHLLGDERGPVLEVIVSRTNFISSHTNNAVRIIGLSTALANAGDLGAWLGIGSGGLFNFHPAVRPVQLEVHINGFPGKHYCPRMATMNKPAYAAIKTHSPNKPVLIFVSSRRQTRLTAFDLVSYVATEYNSKEWLHMDEKELDPLLTRIQDTNLRFSLSFGIGLHHAGLHEKDRKIVEELFVNQKIQILIATATLAWGVNFPAHLVIVKGTEYYDGKTCRYVDYPITDVLQMMGRAGRPQYDDFGVAVIFVQDIKKDFYKKFLYEPFPVESNLLAVLSDHLNAEIVAGTITSKQDALDYVTWTYFFRRLLRNPSYYQLEDASGNHVNKFLTNTVDHALQELNESYCINLEEDDRTIRPEVLGCIASYYYLHHKTIKLFHEKLNQNSKLEEILVLVSESSEYDELPVRHNEDKLNSTLATHLRLPVDPQSYSNPHTKTFLLFQAHFSHVSLPIADYITDTKSILDQALRILQALVDISANEGWLQCTLYVMFLVQMCVQGLWYYDSSILTLPYMEVEHLNTLNNALIRNKSLIKRTGIRQLSCLPELCIVQEKDKRFLDNALNQTLSSEQITQIKTVLNCLPLLNISWSLKSQSEDNEEGISLPVENGSIVVPCDKECVLEVVIKRTSLERKSSHRHIYAPRFPKTKDEGWWLVLGEVDTKDLLAMKRLGAIHYSTRSNILFVAPPYPCHVIYTLYVISDCYLGLDQQYDICIQCK